MGVFKKIESLKMIVDVDYLIIKGILLCTIISYCINPWFYDNVFLSTSLTQYCHGLYITAVVSTILVLHITALFY